MPDLLRDLHQVHLQPGKTTHPPEESIQRLFPRTGKLPPHRLLRGAGPAAKPYRVGVLFSGGQSAGGHNVVIALYEALQELNSGSQLIGFLDGADGLLQDHTRPLDKELLASYRNQGGFDLLGTSRTKIATEEQFQAALHTLEKRKLDSLVMIGGDDTNTNAALLAERSQSTAILGIPKTIDGDLRSEEIEISFGFDSACKTYAELIGNVARDALSAKKYYHFVKVMGRSASHIALECALLTQPNLTLIGEERHTLPELIGEIVSLIRARKKVDKNYGVILLPEGLVDFIPDLLSALPQEEQKRLEQTRDPHGNIAISQIETEQLLLSLAKKELGPLPAITHFFGYEGRSCLPSNFDATYGYALGRLAALAIRQGITGSICAIQGLRDPPIQWRGCVVPASHLMHMEERHGKQTPVIRKAYVDLNGEVFKRFASQRDRWRLEDCYLSPGPIQFFGPEVLTDRVPLSLSIRN
jgi:pyrophosphate--fructose-6-phosphate 1-phosphotransferase